MDPPKLTRTNSSLLRSSPTVRSSIHSLSSIIDVDNTSDDEDIELLRRKTHHNHNQGAGASSVCGGNNNKLFSLVATLALVATLMIGVTFVYVNSTEITSSENILVVLVFVAVGLYYFGKTKNRGKTRTRSNFGSVQWFIGEEKITPKTVPKPEVKERVEHYNNGDVYEGEFYGGKSNGNGVYNYRINEGKYEGEWVDGKYDGYGIERWSKGSKYRGMYRVGLRNGYGVYRFYTGDCYSGQWVNGLYHGFGVQCCCDGSCYFGEFKCGVKHGLGCYHFRNGDRYAGEYFGDKIHGFGVYNFANGHCYEGSWHEGRKQGYGMYTFRNGDAKCGEWNFGSLKIPLPSLTDSVLRAVQAARKAAEKAINLRRVDDQVDKAVVGANRAATAARVAAIKAVQNRMDASVYDTYALL